MPQVCKRAKGLDSLGIYADKSSIANRDGLKSLYSNLTYYEIPGTGHFLMMEKPEEFNRLLREFHTL